MSWGLPVSTIEEVRGGGGKDSNSSQQKRNEGVAREGTNMPGKVH